MSQDDLSTRITARHYQVVCGLALSAVFLLQLQQDLVLALNLLMLLVGAAGILYRARLSPVFFLVILAVAHAVEQHERNLVFDMDTRGFRFFDLGDLLLATAALVFLVGQYRLHVLWFGVLPDARQPALSRSEESLTSAELVGLIFTIPAFALLADFAVLALLRNWSLVDLPPRWKQLLAIVWIVLIVMFVAAHAFRYWRRLQMDRATAMLLVQDILWQETRGEQRRISRWIAWRKQKDRERGDA